MRERRNERTSLMPPLARFHSLRLRFWYIEFFNGLVVINRKKGNGEKIKVWKGPFARAVLSVVEETLPAFGISVGIQLAKKCPCVVESNVFCTDMSQCQ
jgi:hypothetical protein